MDKLVSRELEQLEQFSSHLDEFENQLKENFETLEEVEKRKDNEYNLWCSILHGDIAKFDHDIQSKQASLQSLQLSHETCKTQQRIEQQKTFVSTTECDKLRNQYDELLKEIEKQSLTHDEHFDILISQILLPFDVFSNILYFIDIQTIFIISRVCRLWNKAIENWRGWEGSSSVRGWNNRDTLFSNSNHEHTPSLSSTTSSQNQNDAGYYQRFRRFTLSIETQKNNVYEIQVEGFSDINALSQDTVSHDKSKHKVVLHPIEGNEQLAKEFSICEVILSNHQKLTQIKANTKRLQSRCESDKQTQKGYQITTQRLTRNVAIVEKQIQELKLQEDSDTNITHFLEQNITSLQRTLEELYQIPSRLEQEDSKLEKEFELKCKELDNDGTMELKQELTKMKQENETLAKALKLEQANLISATQTRDDLKQKYELLKDAVAKSLL